MQRLHTLQRIVKVGATNLFRNSWLTIAATAVMVVALIIIQLAVVLNVTANNAIEELASNLKASVYLTEGITDDQRDALRDALLANEYVSDVQYVSNEQAQKELASDFQNNTEILQAYALVGEGVLPASLRVSVSDLSKISEVETVAGREEFKPYVSNISLGQTDAKKTIDRAAAAQNFITIASIISASTLSVISIMIIFNTIRMAIYTRREEIRIMKLIGATPNYIRGPFLVEASLYGVIAGILANSAVYTIVLSLGGRVSEQREFVETYTFFTQSGTFIIMQLGAILLGILIGLLSSTLAMERHLKLKNW